MGKMFIDVSTLPGLKEDPPVWDGFGFFQLMFLAAAYGYILFTASGLISEGSELLLFTSFKDLVGSVVLPILGAVPDGAIILFSGSSQTQLAVGVGALAGSTIMLLTIPWALAIVAGRVRVEDGVPNYTKMASGQKRPDGSWAGQLTSTACAVDVKGGLGTLGWFMLITSTTYLVIQGPALKLGCLNEGCGCLTGDGTSDAEKKCLLGKAKQEGLWALGGMALAWIFFAIYLIFNALAGGDDAAPSAWDAKAQDAADKYLQQGINLHGICAKGQVSRDVLMKVAEKKFNQLDANKSRDLDSDEIRLLVTQFDEMKSARGEPRTLQTCKLHQVCLRRLQESPGKVLGLKDWQEIFEDFMKAKPPFEMDGGDLPVLDDSPRASQDELVDELDEELYPLKEEKKAEQIDPEEEEEEEVMPDDLAKLPADQQMYMLWRRSLCMMLGGTFFVLLFSDPMVDVLAGIGTFLGIPPFYVSFVLAPLASNAAELLSAMNYAAKQTKTSYTLGVSQLLGAACMNNTFCLAIFLSQIYGAKLIWEFSAETLAILVVEMIMFVISQKQVFPTYMCIFIMLLFPLSIVLVYVLENIVGLD